MLAVLDHIHQLGRRVRVENPYQIQHLETVAPLPEFRGDESAVLYLRTYTGPGTRTEL